MVNDEYPETVAIGSMDVPVSRDLRERCDRIIEREGWDGDRELVEQIIAAKDRDELWR